MKKQNKKQNVKISEKLAEKARNFNEKKLEEFDQEAEKNSIQALDSGKKELKKEEKSEKEEKLQEILNLREQLKKAESDNLYLRAEFENFKRRVLEERSSQIRYEGSKFISSLATEVLDDLERALQASQENQSLEDLQKGLKMIHKKTSKLLAGFGVEVLDPTGKLFDPSYQEALSFVTSSKIPEDYVVETYKKAYKMHDKVIRPAQVVVAKKE